VGLNVLRNGGSEALSAAAASGADFIRVNVWTGAAVTDQGIVQGIAREVLLTRCRLEAEVRIAADVLVKHATPLTPLDAGQAAREAVLRGGADILLVTGPETGSAVDLDRLARVRAAVPGVPVWAASGVDATNAALFREACDAAVVGTALHRDRDLAAPLERDRVRAVVEAFADAP
jgi:uncharacterized protein